MSEVLTISIALFVILFVYLQITKPEKNNLKIPDRRVSHPRQYYLTEEEREELLKKVRTVNSRVIRWAPIDQVRKWDDYKLTHLFSFEKNILEWTDLTDSQLEDTLHLGAAIIQKAGYIPY